MALTPQSFAENTQYTYFGSGENTLFDEWLR
jgi:hypothetical protein